MIINSRLVNLVMVVFRLDKGNEIERMGVTANMFQLELELGMSLAIRQHLWVFKINFKLLVN